MGTKSVTPEDSEDRSIDDHSNSVNFGLVNLESKSKSETSYETFYQGLGWKELIELVIGVMIIIYVAILVKRFLNKRKKKQKDTKSVKMSELIKRATQPTAPPPPPLPPTPFPQSFSIAIPQAKMPPMDMTMKMLEDTSAKITPITFSSKLYD